MKSLKSVSVVVIALGLSSIFVGDSRAIDGGEDRAQRCKQLGRLLDQLCPGHETCAEMATEYSKLQCYNVD